MSVSLNTILKYFELILTFTEKTKSFKYKLFVNI